MDNSILIPLLAVGAIMTILALSISVWGARRVQSNSHSAADLLSRLNAAVAEIGDLRVLLVTANQELARLRPALDVATVEIGRLRSALEVANIEIGRLRAALGVETLPDKRPAKPLLLAQCNKIFGEDDAIAIRRVGIPFQRLQNCTSSDLDRYLQAGRQDRQTPWWLQISAHMGPTGIQFADGVKSTSWLSQRIRGIRVLVLAGCENEEVGSQLVGLARHVILVYESIDSQSAQDFSFAFWREIGDGTDPPDAFARALDECPQVSEFIQMRTAR